MQKSTDDIITPRLILRLMNKEMISNFLENDLEGATLLLNAKIPVEMLDHLSSLRYGLKQFEDLDYLPWSARAIILAGENQMIGLVRFHSKPNPEYLREYATNAVELGYRIIKDYRKKGYATEAAIAIMNWANINFGVENFIASVSPENKDSLKLISRLGFKKISEVMDDIDGLEFVFLRNIIDHL